MRRREFLRTAALAASTVSLARAKSDDPTRRRLLILGGTGFLGRNLAEEARVRGHQVTLLHLHEDKSALVPGVQQILADRDKTLPSSLSGRDYDFVIDTSGQKPAWLEESCARLKDCQRYLFVSTISVYQHSRKPLSEDSPLAATEGVKVDSLEPGNYAARKILCERALQQALGNRSLIFRPCVIAGPYDQTDRFTYWADRMRRPGPVLAPVSPQETVQWIDARDLCGFMLDALEADRDGIYNVAGDSIGFGSFLESFHSDSNPVWVSGDFLEKAGVRPWQDIPLWVPGDSDNAGFSRVINGKARQAGLRLRAATQTATATLAWRDLDKTPLKAGLSAEKEADLLKAWRLSGP